MVMLTLSMQFDIIHDMLYHIHYLQSYFQRSSIYIDTLDDLYLKLQK